MAWEISITAEGWYDIYETLHDPDKVSRETLIEAIAADEWDAAEENDVDDVDDDVDDDADEEEEQYKGSDTPVLSLEAIYFERKKELDSLPHDVLADKVFNQIESINTCDNGGNGYWMSRDGGNQLYVKENQDDDDHETGESRR